MRRISKKTTRRSRGTSAKEKTLLEKIGAIKRPLIVSKALDDALHILAERPTSRNDGKPAFRYK